MSIKLPDMKEEITHHDDIVRDFLFGKSGLVILLNAGYVKCGKSQYSLPPNSGSWDHLLDLGSKIACFAWSPEAEQVRIAIAPSDFSTILTVSVAKFTLAPY